MSTLSEKRVDLKGDQDSCRPSGIIGPARKTLDNIGQVDDVKCDRYFDRFAVLYAQKTGVPVWLPLPEFVLEALEGFGNEKHFFWTGAGLVKTAIANWQRSLARLGKLAGVKFHAHQLRDSFAVDLLTKEISLETVSVLLGNSLKVCERHYQSLGAGQAAGIGIGD